MKKRAPESGVKRRTRIRTKASALTTAGDLAGAAKLLKREGLPPISPALIGPAKGKNGSGHPRTGNKAIRPNFSDPSEIGSSHAHLDHAYNRFLEGIEEGELHQALATHPGPAELRKNKYQQALLMLTHPRYVKVSRRDGPGKDGGAKNGAWSIAAIMKHAGVTLQELMEVYGRYRIAQATRIAMDRSPTIISHAADDAENRKVVCPRCDGLGTLDIDAAREEVQEKRRKAILRTCPECEGSGRVMQSGDAEARKLVLEVAGLVGKKGPVVDARSVHYGNGVFSVESLVKSMEAGEQPTALIEDGSRSILDAEEVTEDQ